MHTPGMSGPRHKVTYRLPLALDFAMQEAARTDGRTKTDWLIEAISAHLGNPIQDRTGCLILWVPPQTLERLKHSARASGRSLGEYAATLLISAAHRP